jgi:putative alpha-1,2-mannosidase
MKKSLSVFLGSLLSLGLFYAKPVLAQKFRGQQLEAVDLVNPLMGTESKFELSNGNTYPSIARPWGMNMWTPQTGKNGDGWQYQYTADKIRG